MQHRTGIAPFDMATDLFRALSDLQPFEDRETANAFFRRHVPELGSAAYLHVIYKPVDQHLLDETGKRLKIPEAFLNFLKRQNGASLFSNTLHIFGVVPKGQMVNRTDPFSLPPFNLEKENSHLSAIDQERFLAFGAMASMGLRSALIVPAIKCSSFQEMIAESLSVGQNLRSGLVAKLSVCVACSAQTVDCSSPEQIRSLM